MAAEGRLEAKLVLSPDRLRKYAYQILLLEEFERSGVACEFAQTPQQRLLVQVQCMKVSRLRGRFISAVYVGLDCNTPSVVGEQDFHPLNVNGHRKCQGFGH